MIVKRSASVVIAMLLSLGSVHSANAIVLDQVQLSASDVAAGDNYGDAVSVSGDSIAVGAFGVDANGSDSGAVYVYSPDAVGGWVETKLIASDGMPNDLFGRSVAIEGLTVVVGAQGSDLNGNLSGAAYVYELDGSGGYTEVKLMASDAAPDSWFGRSVAIEGGLVVVGAMFDDANGLFNSGSVYVFQPDRSGGYSEFKLRPATPSAADFFGESVAIDDGIIVVGANGVDGNASNSGAVFVFEPDGSGGYHETRLLASDGGQNDNLGASVAISEGIVVAGAPQNDEYGLNAGAAYVFEPDGFGAYMEFKLLANDGEADDRFGLSVATHSGIHVIGSPWDDDLGSSTGAAYVFEPDPVNGLSQTKLIASDAARGDAFGDSVSFDGQTLVVGSPGQNVAGPVSGSAYVFNVLANPDVEAPTITAIADRTANALDWFNQPVTFTFECTDAQSGVALCPSPVTILTEAAGQMFEVSATDNAGNVATLAVSGINIDLTAPTVAVDGVTDGDTFEIGVQVSPTCSTMDSLSGVAAEAAMTVTGGNSDGSGVYTATCSGAVDAAGNATPPVSATWEVHYATTADVYENGSVSAPPAVNVGHGGRVYRLRWTLADAQGAPITDPGAVTSIDVEEVACASFTGTSSSMTNAETKGSGLTVNNGVFNFNWATPSVATTTCYVLHVNLVDGNALEAHFQLD